MAANITADLLPTIYEHLPPWMRQRFAAVSRALRALHLRRCDRLALNGWDDGFLAYTALRTLTLHAAPEKGTSRITALTGLHYLQLDHSSGGSDYPPAESSNYIRWPDIKSYRYEPGYERDCALPRLCEIGYDHAELPASETQPWLTNITRLMCFETGPRVPAQYTWLTGLTAIHADSRGPELDAAWLSAQASRITSLEITDTCTWTGLTVLTALETLTLTNNHGWTTDWLSSLTRLSRLVYEPTYRLLNSMTWPPPVAGLTALARLEIPSGITWKFRPDPVTIRLRQFTCIDASLTIRLLQDKYIEPEEIEVGEWQTSLRTIFTGRIYYPNRGSYL